MTGYILFAVNEFSRIPLDNLRVIRGTTLYDRHYALAVMINYQKEGPHGLRELGLTHLTGMQLRYDVCVFKVWEAELEQIRALVRCDNLLLLEHFTPTQWSPHPQSTSRLSATMCTLPVKSLECDMSPTAQLPV